MEYYTESKTDVTDRIDEEMTIFFSIADYYGSQLKAKEVADDYAKQKKSYAYPVYILEGRGCDKVLVIAGYGVPK